MQQQKKLKLGGNLMGRTGGNTEKNQGGKKRHSLSLTGKILGISIVPVIIMGIVLTFAGTRGIREGMQEEVFSALEAVAVSVDAAYSAVDGGDYSLSGSDKLMKGSLNVTENVNLIDSFTKGNDKEITLFYGDVRYATTLVSNETGERILGTKADESVYNRVVEQGETVHLNNIAINNTDYYACYLPMKNSDGSIAGMYFAGQPADSVNAFVRSKVITVIIALVIITTIALVAILYFTATVKKGIVAAGDAVSQIASGILNVEIDGKGLKRNDELGDMMREVRELQHQLKEVVSNIKTSVSVLNREGNELSNMASGTSVTADDIGRAVEGISNGAVSQADDVENASERIDTIGSMIDAIVASADNLDRLSGDMKSNGDEALAIINDLVVSNNDTIEAIEKIGSRVNATNESAARISEAVNLITSIAEETNLLSLNASIEAARAGEQGRGFAVVAGQIQKLAEQSNESAGSIAVTINELIADSGNTVAVMSDVQKIVNKQQEKFEQTKQQFANVHRGIDRSHEEAEDIKIKTNACGKEKDGVVEIISSLSSVSEENAASAQQTMVSMEKLNSSINILAGSAANLKSLSEDLQKSVEIFKI